MTGLAQLALILVVGGLLLWGSAAVNVRLRPGDAIWQKTQRKLLAVGKGIATTGAIVGALVLLVAAATALFG